MQGGLAHADPPAAATAHAATPAPPVDNPERMEPAGFPILGGDSDVGVMFGFAGTLTRYSRNVRPYLWNMDLVLAGWAKGDGNGGTDLAQYSAFWQIDMPHVGGREWRINPSFSARHIINQSYFGLGNGSPADPPAGNTAVPGRFFQFEMVEVRARSLARVTLSGPWSGVLGLRYRFVEPNAYAGSRLALDAAGSTQSPPSVSGLGALHYVEATAGVIYDTRDSEALPSRGMFNQFAVRLLQAMPGGDTSVRYAGLAASIVGYVPVAGPVVFAGRVMADVEIGNVPFSDLFMGGPFTQQEMPGGSSGIRGVPTGRYLGPLKVVTNLEFRSVLARFRVFHQPMSFGVNAFFDAGRLWSSLSLSDPRDGAGAGIHWGAGGGVFLKWGGAAVFRIEAAYSPDARAENPSLPIGIYVEDGVMF